MLNQRWPRDLKNHRGGTNPAWGREEVIREDFPKEVTPALLLELFFPFIKMAFLSSIRSFFFFFFHVLNTYFLRFYINQALFWEWNQAIPWGAPLSMQEKVTDKEGMCLLREVASDAREPSEAPGRT